jgi:hypothetical protein
MTGRALIALAVALAACSAPVPADVADATLPDASAQEDAGSLDATALDAAEPSDADGLDALVSNDATAGPDAGGMDLDAGTNDAGAEDDADIVSLDDAGAADAGLADLDAGTPDLDAGSVEPDAGDLDAGTMDDAGPMEADAGPPDAGAEPDAGSDAGPPDAGYDAGPPPCLSDPWEPNDTQATARLLATCTTNAGLWNIDRPTFSGADSDWYRIDVRRTTTRPTHVRVSTPPGVTAWLRIRYVCDSGIPTCSAGAARISNYCERVALADVDLTATCPDLSGNAAFYVEATRPSLAACVYSPTFELEPG